VTKKSAARGKGKRKSNRLTGSNEIRRLGGWDKGINAEGGGNKRRKGHRLFGGN